MKTHEGFQALTSRHGAHELLCGYTAALPFLFIFNITKCSLAQILGFHLPVNSVTQQRAAELSLSKCKINKYYTWQKCQLILTGLSSASGLAQIFAPASSQLTAVQIWHNTVLLSTVKLHNIHLFESIHHYTNSHLFKQPFQSDSAISQVFSGQNSKNNTSSAASAQGFVWHGTSFPCPCQMSESLEREHFILCHKNKATQK